MRDNYGVDCDRPAIFVDDSPANILAAQQVGLRTLLAVNGEDWTDSLLDSLGEEKVIPTL